MENLEILIKKGINMIKRLGAKEFVIQALTWIFFSLLILVYWAPRIMTWEMHGLWAIAAFLTWILTRAGANIALFYFDKNKITQNHIASIFASAYIIPMLFQINIYKSILVGPYFIISLFCSVIIIHSLFRKFYKNVFLNILKSLSVGILGSVYYWFLNSIIMDFYKNTYLYHQETGGIITLLLSITIGMIVIFLQIISSFRQKKKLNLSNSMRMLIIFLFLVLVMNIKIFAWGEKVHQRISEYSLRYSLPWETDFFLKLNLDKGKLAQRLIYGDESKSIMELISCGAIVEDASLSNDIKNARSGNHFHNPLKSLWEEAGLTDIQTPLDPSPLSAILWAQNGERQDMFPEYNNSWKGIRENYYQGLIESGLRDMFFWQAFKGLGHQIHLIQDMAVPDHVRNDSHPLNSFWKGMFSKKYGWHYRCIEGWAENNLSLIENFIDNKSKIEIVSPNLDLSTPSVGSLVPFTKLVDDNVYLGTAPTNISQQGLAEYSNGNFMSEDTMFTENYSNDDKHFFPFPKRSSTNLFDIESRIVLPEVVTSPDNRTDLSLYLKKERDGEIINHFLRLGYFSQIYSNPELPPSFLKSFIHDQFCHKDYASMLIPRGVAYSTALLNYFFRGAIEVTNPVEGIYSLCINPNEGFKKISLMVKNIAGNNEEMKNGRISLVISYRMCAGDPFVPNPPIPGDERLFKIIKYLDPINPIDFKIINIPKDNPIRLDFDLSSTPLPSTAMDITLTVVFKGDLGAEIADAVAIGFKDISEPTPVDLFNSTDLVCFNDKYVNYADPALLQQVDTNHNGVIDCDHEEINIIPTKITPLYLSFNGIAASATNYYYKYPETNPIEILPKQTHRFYFLSDDDPAMTSYSIKVKAENSPDSTISWAGVCPVFFNNNPEDAYSYYNKIIWDTDQYVPLHAGIGTFRDKNYFNILIFKNVAVPENSVCTYGSGLTQIVGTPTEDHKSNSAHSPKSAEKNKTIN